MTDFSSDTALVTQFSEQDQAILQVKLWRLLARRTALYTMDDSSSIRTETAQELFASICFLLRFHCTQNQIPFQQLLVGDEEEQFADALQTVSRHIELGKHLYETLRLHLPCIDHRALLDTVSGIALFFKRYDYRYFAQQIPCDIEYPLAHPVPDSFLGIEYINEYLRRLLLENRVLSFFPNDRVIALLSAYCPDYQDAIINLYDPILTNAIGCTLIQKDIFSLSLNRKDQETLFALLTPLPPDEPESLLKRTARSLARKLGVQDPDSQAYLIQTAVALSPRIRAATAFDGIFINAESSQSLK
ncbi:MAG: DUF6179 domain-containing protein [Evtepia sp.]